MTGRTLMMSVTGTVVLTLTLGAQVVERPEVLLQAAIKQELVDGDLKGALERYKALASSGNPAVAAQALIRLASVYDKLGHADTRATYERVVREFPGQEDVVNEARRWLGAHGRASLRAGRSVEQASTGRPSADGRYFASLELAHTDDGSETQDLFVRDLKSGEHRLVVPGTKDDFAFVPRLSPNGKRIAYGWNRAIRLIDSDGNNMRILTQNLHNMVRLEAWSPDGNYLAAQQFNNDKTAAIVLISTLDGSMTQLRSLSSAGSRFPRIGEFSPDGRFLSYGVGADPAIRNGGVFVLSVDGSREVALVEGEAAFGAPYWSPDGRRLLFTSDRSGVPDLWSIGFTNGQPDGEPELLQGNVGTMIPTGFTQDGSFYYGLRDSQVEAYSAAFDPDNLTLSHPVRITDRAVGNNQAPEFSPDGKAVTFVRRRAGVAHDEVIVRSTVTGDERAVTTLGGNAYRARTLEWFPDSRSVLVTDAVNERKRFRQVSVGSRDERVLFEGPWDVWIGALSVDGKSLFYSIKEDDIIRLVKRRLDTGEETELYRRTDLNSPGLYGLAASPDGTQLVFAVNETEGRSLLSVPTHGGEAREIYRFPTTYGDVWIVPAGAMAWTKDSRNIVFTGKCGPGDDQQFCVVSAEGGEPKSMGLTMGQVESRMISADGRRLAFTGRAGNSGLWVIRNLLSESNGMR